MKLTNSRKITIALIGTLSGVLAIGGAIKLKNAHDQKIAFENRPIIDQECVMNGFGQGNCSFTNTGKSSGSACGIIQVYGPVSLSSGTFCSGKVDPQSTVKVEFSIPQVNIACDDGYSKWSDICSFNFILNDESKPKFEGLDKV